MKKYGVAFHHSTDNKCYCGIGFIHSEFDKLADARAYARGFNNSHIYRLQWTENGKPSKN